MSESIYRTDRIVNPLDRIRSQRFAGGSVTEVNPRRWPMTAAWLAGSLSDVGLLIIERALPCPGRARGVVGFFLGRVVR